MLAGSDDGVLQSAGGDQRGSAAPNSLIGRLALSALWRLVEVGRNVERQQRKVTVRLGQERESSSGSKSRGGAGWLDAGGTLMSLVAAATKQLAQHDSCSW